MRRRVGSPEHEAGEGTDECARREDETRTELSLGSPSLAYGVGGSPGKIWPWMFQGS
jgi:hypothetical protein